MEPYDPDVEELVREEYEEEIFKPGDEVELTGFEKSERRKEIEELISPKRK
jgi:hypothetical protein